ncbi:Carotenoid 9,10(9',10')-cleavage dioxygenase 1 [Fulvia fulva]|nr:Carotenoid 9,10(9',10')-cleavage dioxygenase 1 [Fulvia fulva]KAK4609583.1 Carotenoid 9,10(9',10')-cleavage dioxygenase 1 [Fulvia fulva]WPV37674.1 Carotenoid 9,10(9',10')-cleavage dioxygenase 1 [Fulvia fulva]
MFDQPQSLRPASLKRKRTFSDNIERTPLPRHPYLTGNFAPIQQTLPLTPCTYGGVIPEELADSEYVRNGSNPVSNEDLGRDAHWFDGDGMLSGVSFTRDDETGHVTPEFVNQFVLTDLYLNTLSSPRLKVPILPSIATLVNPVASFIYVTLRILRTILLVILSHLPGSKQKIKKISVANTNLVFHDGRALATCESGPPMRIQLPGLETVGWYDGAEAEGEPKREVAGKETVLGQDGGLFSFMREWTTAHPKVDPLTKEMLMFHSSFAPPFVQYSIIPQSPHAELDSTPLRAYKARQDKILNAAVPGVKSAKMMHDFGVSSTHTVIMDLPLSLDPVNQLKGLPPVTYNSSKPSRFGVFPRRHPEKTQWFETDACCIFHTANTWDDSSSAGGVTGVNMLACRLTTATVIFAAGNIAPPVEKKQKVVAAARKRMPFFSKYDADREQTYYDHAVESPSDEKEPLLRIRSNSQPLADDDDLFNEDQCRLYYYHFDLQTKNITHQWALAAIPLEFPSVRPDVEMVQARYIYGCSTTTTDFGSALGKAAKIDALVKIDAGSLIARGKEHPPISVTGVVDSRSMAQILESEDLNDPIQVFRMPKGWFAQEPRFVPASTNVAEDDGWLLFYAFDESQLLTNGDVPKDSDPRARAKSELWILDARDMTTLVARVHLPQRVPYGLHGTWFSAEEVRGQRAVDSIRTTARALEARERGAWMRIRDWVERMLG